MKLSHSELQAVFRALPDLYFRVDAEGRYLDYYAGRPADLYAAPEDFLGKRDAFFALDSKWRFTDVNGEAERAPRRRREDLLGRTIWDEFPDFLGSTFYTEYHKAISHHEGTGRGARWPHLG